MTNYKNIAQKAFLKYILTTNPNTDSFFSVWKSHIYINHNCECSFFETFFEAAAAMQEKNFEGYIFRAHCSTKDSKLQSMELIKIA